jgi:hypothetical protein
MLGVRSKAVITAAATAALIALAAAAGCGPDGAGSSAASGAEAPAELLGERPGVLRCTDWNEGTEAERRGTIEQITALAGANANPEEPGSERTLPDDEAYNALDGTCEEHLARGFLLYEIYNRAAAFEFESD